MENGASRSSHRLAYKEDEPALHKLSLLLQFPSEAPSLTLNNAWSLLHPLCEAPGVKEAPLWLGLLAPAFSSLEWQWDRAGAGLPTDLFMPRGYVFVPQFVLSM